MSAIALTLFSFFLAFKFSLLASQSQTETACAVFLFSLVGLLLHFRAPYKSRQSRRLDYLEDLFSILLIAISYPLFVVQST